MREGSLEAPTRHPINWQDPDFTDPAKVEAEMRRVFDLCHSCRRCFNLCDSFPRLFDLIDAAGDDELDGVDSADFKQVVDACTLCDMCFMTKCPYVPPHEFDLDFPHLMLRYRAMEFQLGEVGFMDKQLSETDRNGTLARPVAPLANWATSHRNRLTRPAMEQVTGVHRDAALPPYHGRTFQTRARHEAVRINTEAPAYGRRAQIFATCFANYNNPPIGMAAQRVLAHNGVRTEVTYPGCCGMPKLEHGNLAAVADKAKRTAQALKPQIDAGWDVVALVPSCALMMKFEWPLIVPDDPDVQRLAQSTYDVTEYVVDIANNEGLAEGLQPLEGGVAIHLACHARAQNMGPKGAEMLRKIPQTKVEVIQRCSGHGGLWGVKKATYPVALKVGKGAFRDIEKTKKSTQLCSECPLAGLHLVQGLEWMNDGATPRFTESRHPIQVMAEAYGLGDGR